MSNSSNCEESCPNEQAMEDNVPIIAYKYNPPMSVDPDYLADFEDYQRSPKFHRNLWLFFLYRSQVEPPPAGKAAKYLAKFDRCQRLVDKKESISAEISENQARQMEEWGVRRTDLSGYSKEDIEALRKKCLEKMMAD